MSSRRVYGEIARAGPVADRRFDVENLEHACARYGGAGKTVDDEADLPHRHLEHRHEHQELRQLADGDLPADHAQAAQPQYKAHREKVGEGHHRSVEVAHPDRFDGRLQRAALPIVEFVEFVLLRRECPHHADAGEVFLHDAGQHAHAFLELAPQRAHLQAEHGAAPHREWHEAHAQETEQQVLPHVQVGAEPHQHGKLEETHDAGLDETPHAFDVEHTARDQVPGVDAVVIAERQTLQLLEKSEPQFVAEALADRFGKVVVREGEKTPHDRCAKNQQRRCHQCRLSSLGRAHAVRAGQQARRMVDGPAEEAWNEELEHPRADDRQHRRGKAHAVAERHAQHAPQRVHAPQVIAVQRRYYGVGAVDRGLDCGTGNGAGCRGLR